MSDGVRNLIEMMALADPVDREEGRLAYWRYNIVMQRVAGRFMLPVSRVAAAFVALSPNNDYAGNLRSLVTCCYGVANGWRVKDITVSTYEHCRDRACAYLTGELDFLATVKGLKIRNFYMNVLEPQDDRYVTVDGHMVAAWRGERVGTMKDFIVRPRQYREIAADVMLVAKACGLLPCQAQATLWFTRKRTLNIRYDPQTCLFQTGDQWRTLVNVEEIKPYENRRTTGRDHAGGVGSRA